MKYFPFNANVMDDETYQWIKTDVQARGFLNPHIFISVDTIIDGNHRWRIAQEIGLEKELKIHDLGPMSDEEMVLLNKWYNTRGGMNYYMLGLGWYRLWKIRIDKEKIKTFSERVAAEFGVRPRMVRQGVLIFKEVPDKYLQSLSATGPFTFLHAYYFAILGRSKRVGKIKGKLRDEDKQWVWDAVYKEIMERKVSVDETQALLRTKLMERMKIILPDLTDIAKYGISVWEADSYAENVRHIIEEGIQLGTYRRGIGHSLSKASRVSSFHVSIAYILLRMLLGHTKEERVVVDPMMGYGIRVLAAQMFEGVTALGFDISPEMVAETKQLYDKTLNVAVADASNIPLPDESTDIVFTCPPYWDKEKYESVPGQLSDYQTYEQFLSSLSGCLADMVRIIKPGGWCALVVSNFRKDGQFYTMAYDVKEIMEMFEMEFWDEVILRRKGHNLSAAESMEKQHTATAHEHLLVFKKGKEDRRTGP